MRIGIPRVLVEKFLRKMVPLVEEVVELFKENADEDGLTPKLKENIARYRVGPWAEAYEDMSIVVAAPLMAMFCLDDEPEVLFKPPRLETVEDFHRWMDSIWDECERFLDDDSDDELGFMDGDEDTKPWLNDCIGDDGKPVSRQAAFLGLGIVFVFNYFSCMVHRKPIFQLIDLAKKKNDSALLKAIQIDKTCLTDNTICRKRIQQATEGGELGFLRQVAQYRNKPIFQSGTALTSLYLVFSLLDAMNLLDAFAKDKARFADFCQSLGIYGPHDDAVDVASFEKTFYRFKNQHQGLSRKLKKSAVTVFVKDTN